MGTHETQKTKSAFYLPSLRQKLRISSHGGFFLVVCFSHLPLDFWLESHTLKTCGLPEFSIIPCCLRQASLLWWADWAPLSRAAGKQNQALLQLRGKWFSLAQNDWLDIKAGCSSFTCVLFVQLTQTQMHLFPDPAGTHGGRDPINVAESSTRPKIPKLLQSGLNVSNWHWDCSQAFGLEKIGLLVNLKMLASKPSLNPYCISSTIVFFTLVANLGPDVFSKLSQWELNGFFPLHREIWWSNWGPRLSLCLLFTHPFNSSCGISKLNKDLIKLFRKRGSALLYFQFDIINLQSRRHLVLWFFIPASTAKC